MREDSSPTDYWGRSHRPKDDHKWPVHCRMGCGAHSTFSLGTFGRQDALVGTVSGVEEMTAANKF